MLLTVVKAVSAEEKKAEPKKRTRKPAAPKEKKPKEDAVAPVSAPAAAETSDIQVGRPCPLCGEGVVIQGKTAYGCSCWKSGCTFRKPLA